MVWVLLPAIGCRRNTQFIKKVTICGFLEMQQILKWSHWNLRWTDPGSCYGLGKRWNTFTVSSATPLVHTAIKFDEQHTAACSISARTTAVHCLRLTDSSIRQERQRKLLTQAGSMDWIRIDGCNDSEEIPQLCKLWLTLIMEQPSIAVPSDIHHVRKLLYTL